MFDRLFACPRAVARHRTSPLAEERLAFLAHLADQGMSHWLLQKFAFHTLAAAHSLRLAERPHEDSTAAEIDEQAGDPPAAFRGGYQHDPGVARARVAGDDERVR